MEKEMKQKGTVRESPLAHACTVLGIDSGAEISP